MKLASFLALSLGLHASVLVYPVAIFVPAQIPPIPVTLLSVEEEPHGSAGQGAQGKAVAHPRAGLSAQSFSPPSVQPGLETEVTSARSPQGIPTETTTPLTERIAILIAPVASSADAHGDAISTSVSNAGQGSGTSPVGVGGLGSGGNSLGNSAGSDNGSTAGTGVTWIQARYSDTPKPSYPESARREGREGRVLLRVLVDDRGRTKSVEINTSSGDEALDRAAVEAVKRWRFHPARHGDKTIASWLRIPIEFRLADAPAW